MEIKITLKNGKEYKISDYILIQEVIELFNNKLLSDDTEIKGKNNTIKKGDILKIENIVEAKKMFWKVRLSYSNETENVVIEQEELLKTQFAFASGSNLIIRQGAFRGKDIISILPEFSMTMGWARSYEPSEEEWQLINNDLDIKKLRSITENAKIACLNVKTLAEANQKFLELNAGKLLLN